MPSFEVPERAFKEVLADEPFSLILPKTSKYPRTEYTLILDTTRAFFFEQERESDPLTISQSLDAVAAFVKQDEMAIFRKHLGDGVREGVMTLDIAELIDWIITERARLANAASVKELDRPTLAQESSTES